MPMLDALPIQESFMAYQESVNQKSKTCYILHIMYYLARCKFEKHKNEAMQHLKDKYGVIFDQEKINKGRFLYDKYEEALKNKIIYSKNSAKIYCGFSWYRGFMTYNNIAFCVGD
jgi:hypothetical protein